MMKKNLSKLYIVVFLLLFFAPTILFALFGEYIDQTNYEQRTSAEKPVLSAGKIALFPKAYEEYYNDHLPFRTQMIEMNSLIDFKLFRQSSVQKVIIGNDGWLFYNPAGSDGDPIADYNGSNLFSDEQLAQMANNLLASRDALREQGKEFVVYIAPNKESIYGNDFLPSDYVCGNTYTRADQVVDYLLENTDLVVIYPKEELLSAIENYPEYTFYYKTDTHWNTLGGYIGASKLMNALDISLPDLQDLQIEVKNSSGDLATMLGLSKHLQYDSTYFVSGYASGNEIQLTYPVPGDGNYEVYTTSGADPRALFVIRDSFSTAMIPYLSSQFNDCFFVHRSLYTPELLNEYPADIVVVQVVERYVEFLLNFSAA